MPFVRKPGLKGMLYVPESFDDTDKKHRCEDCFSCQMCGDDRCRLCKGQKSASAPADFHRCGKAPQEN